MGSPSKHGLHEESDESEEEALQEIAADDVNVAIFCALVEESTAVRYTLDKEFTCRASGKQSYVYTVGSIGAHNVVIAEPAEMGPVNAAHCAAYVSQQFPNVRLALMVGIGAGIPSNKLDIRLGDIAISAPRDNHPGVIQYDLGKYEAGAFKQKGSLNKPPRILTSAIRALEGDELRNRSPIRRILKSIIKQKDIFRRPDSDDILFDNRFPHVQKGSDCSACLASDDKISVPRPPRQLPNQPVTHRGLILSGGGVIKNHVDREQLRRGYESAICFEMEAAGIMDELPCLVIRGISDYGDTHKHDEWHYYAAAVAAAYCKAVLLKVPGDEITETPRMQEMVDKVNEIHRAVHETQVTVKETHEIKQNQEILNWLTPFDYGPQHSDYLRRRQPGTGQWLLDHETYQKWVEEPRQILFCPGIPGAGKTILSSIVIDDLESRFSTDLTTVVVYIYSNFNRQAEQSLEHLMSSLLKQLANNSPLLPQVLSELHEKHAKKKTRPTLEEITTALRTVTATFARVFIVVDALDECQVANDCRTRFLQQLFGLQTQQRLSVFATSRHIPDIKKEFLNSLTIEIRASEEDIGRYLKSAVLRLPRFVAERSDLQDEITQTISQVVDGMFLLAQLYCDSLIDKYNPTVLREALQDLKSGSKSYTAAYDSAMKRIAGQLEGQAELAKQVLAWITCAQRPLTQAELQHALAVKVGEARLDEDNITQIHDMISVCAGLVTVDAGSDTVRLIHETTKQYLEQTREVWYPNAHLKIAESCTTYLSFEHFSTGSCLSDEEFELRLEYNPLYKYSACNWGYHARRGSAYEEMSLFLQKGAQIEAASQALLVTNQWSRKGYSQRFPKRTTGLHLAAFFGLERLLKVLSSTSDINVKDSLGQTALFWAARNGHAAAITTLLESGATTEVEDRYGGTCLWWAVRNGYIDSVKLLTQDCCQTAKVGIQNTESKPIRTSFESIILILHKYGEDVQKLLKWLENHFDYTGSVKDADRAVETIRIAAQIDAIDRDCHMSWDHYLSKWLGKRHLRTGSSTDAEEAIQLARKAISRMAVDSVPADLSTNLGNLLRCRFRSTGSIDDLEESIHVLQQTLDLTPLYDEDRAGRLQDLGEGYSDRYQRTGAMADLGEAIKIGRQAIDRTPSDHPDMPARFNNLAKYLGNRYSRTGAIDDLEEAIEIGRQAVDRTPQDHPDRPAKLNNLANRLKDRYSGTGAMADLGDAIYTGRQAVETTPQGHPDRARWLNDLASYLEKRYSRTGAMADLELSYCHSVDSLTQSTASTADRIVAGRRLLLSDWALRDTSNVINHATMVLELLPQLAPRFLKNADKQYLLAQAAGLASNAAAIALIMQQAPWKAVTWLEAGRSILSSGIQDLRTDIFALQQTCPDLAAAFDNIRAILAASVEANYEDFCSSPGLCVRRQMARRRQAHGEFEKIIQEIRNQPGFNHFLRPPTEDEVLATAANGPIILINVSRHRCDALIVSPTGVQCVELPDGLYNDIQEHQKNVTSPSHTMLQWLWDCIVDPVLTQLGLLNSPSVGEQWPRVWWIPTGPLVGFPLHAAGYHLERQGRTTLDRVVSSYATSIRSIRSAVQTRQQSQQENATASRIALVAMTDTPERGRLHFASHEIRSVQAVCQSMGLQPIIPSPLKRDVLSALQFSQMFHFAGHVETHTDPLKSLLPLDDWKTDPLTVDTVIQTNLSSIVPFLAYLSACGTSQIRDKDYVDESIDLTAAFQLAGFRHVIGTLWSPDDSVCVDVAKMIYEVLRDDGINDKSVREGLHHASLKLRDLWIERLNVKNGGSGAMTLTRDAELDNDTDREESAYWIPYVHYGA